MIREACYFKVTRQSVLKLRGRGRVGHVTLSISFFLSCFFAQPFFKNKNFGRRFQPSCVIVVNRFYRKHDNSNESCYTVSCSFLIIKRLELDLPAGGFHKMPFLYLWQQTKREIWHGFYWFTHDLGLTTCKPWLEQVLTGVVCFKSKLFIRFIVPRSKMFLFIPWTLRRETACEPDNEILLWCHIMR